MNKPVLVMFAGPNGSGKSSVTPIFQNQPGFPQKYINEGIEKIDSDNQKVYNIPGGVNIEKDRDSLSISYKDKSVQFDQDFNVLKNELSDLELRRINQQIQVIKQNSIEQSRSKRIEQDIDIDR